MQLLPLIKRKKEEQKFMSDFKNLQKIQSSLKKKHYRKVRSGITLIMGGDKSFVSVVGIDTADTFRLNELLLIIKSINNKINEDFSSCLLK